jgi:site-specific DNA-methyltransferase (adenine-specific)
VEHPEVNAISGTMRVEKIGNSSLYLGDALEVLPTLSGFDAAIMDPPYAIPTQVAATRQTHRSVGDLSLVEATFRLVFDSVSDALRKGGRVFTFCDGQSYPVVYRSSYARFQSALLIWDKGRIGMGREFRKSHELILHCWTPDTPVCAPDGIGRPDILRFAPVGDEKEHPAEKPVPLLIELLRVCGERICDPFMGGGSVGVAAVKVGKPFVGIEIEPRHFDTACRRIEEAYRQRDLFNHEPAPEDPADTRMADLFRPPED